jgi:hypothetical protein
MPPMHPPHGPPPEWLTDTASLDETARHWRLSRERLKALLGTGRIPFVQVRGEIRVPREELKAGPHR